MPSDSSSRVGTIAVDTFLNPKLPECLGSAAISADAAIPQMRRKGA